VFRQTHPGRIQIMLGITNHESRMELIRRFLAEHGNQALPAHVLGRERV